MSREHRYHLTLSWVGAAQGSTTSYQAYSREYEVRIKGKAPMQGSADPLFRGDPTLHNPEELLVAALSSCHMLSFLAEASRVGLAVLAYSDAAEGTMIFEGGGGYFTNVTLHPHVTVLPESDPAQIESLHEKAHATCFIARSVNFPVQHVASITFGEG